MLTALLVETLPETSSISRADVSIFVVASSPSIFAAIAGIGVRIDKNRFCNTWIVTPEVGTICDVNPPDYWPSKMDCLGHGTAMASLIGGKTYGVAKKVRLIAYSTFWAFAGYPCSGGGAQVSTTTAFGAALDEARVQLRVGHPNVVNLSWGAQGQSPTIEGLISNLLTAGATVVTGAGNDNLNACDITPARMAATTAVITVGASNPTDGRWWQSTFNGSGYGPCVTLFAPGSEMKTATSAGDASYAVGGPGTSNSTAIVSGVAALYLSTHPDRTAAAVKAGLVQLSTAGRLDTTHPQYGIWPGSPNKLIYSRVPRGDLPPMSVILTLLGFK